MVFKHLGKNDCDRIKELLSEYLGQHLNSEDRARVESHLKVCESCRRDYESLQATVGLLSRVPSAAAPRSFIITGIAPLPYPSFFRALRTATAVLAVMLVLLFAGDVTHILPAMLPEGIVSPTPAVSDTSPSFPPGGDEMIKVKSEGAEIPDGSVAGEVIPPAKVGEEGPAPQGVQDEEELPSPSDVILEAPSPVSETPAEGLWWLRPLELTLLGIVVVTGGMTLFIWRRHRVVCKTDK